MPIPHEIYIGEIFIPPLLAAAFFGLIATSITAKLLNKYRLSKHFFYPPLVMVALMVIYTVILGMIFIPF